jgi:hypothetical protein
LIGVARAPQKAAEAGEEGAEGEEDGQEEQEAEGGEGKGTPHPHRRHASLDNLKLTANSVSELTVFFELLSSKNAARRSECVTCVMKNLSRR